MSHICMYMYTHLYVDYMYTPGFINPMDTSPEGLGSCRSYICMSLSLSISLSLYIYIYFYM